MINNSAELENSIGSNSNLKQTRAAICNPGLRQVDGERSVQLRYSSTDSEPGQFGCRNAFHIRQQTSRALSRMRLRWSRGLWRHMQDAL